MPTIEDHEKRLRRLERLTGDDASVHERRTRLQDLWDDKTERQGALKLIRLVQVLLTVAVAALTIILTIKNIL